MKRIVLTADNIREILIRKEVYIETDSGSVEIILDREEIWNIKEILRDTKLVESL